MRYDANNKIYYDLMELMSKYSREVRGATTVAMVNGTFDLLHPGHYHLFEEASKLTDYLVVFTNTDESIRGLKGDSRPLIPLKHRLKVLSSIVYIDAVYPFDELRVTDYISQLRPNIWVKASDYTIDTIDPDELSIAENSGVEIRLIETLEEYSSTNLIDKIIKSKMET